MFTQEELHNKIDAYLSGKLSNEEMKEFSEKLKTDKKFAEEVELHRKIISAVRDESMAETRKILAETDRSLALPSLNRRRNFYMAAAAFAILLISAGITIYIVRQKTAKNTLVQQNKTEIKNEKDTNITGDSNRKHKNPFRLQTAPGQKLLARNLYDKYFEIYPSRYANIRGNPDDSFMSAMNLYSQKKYEECHLILNRLAINPAYSDRKTDIDFYNAMCSMKKGKYKKAYKILHHLSINENPYQYESRWYIALLQLNKNRLAEAKQTLHSIIESGTYNSGKAIALLNDIKNLK